MVIERVSVPGIVITRSEDPQENNSRLIAIYQRARKFSSRLLPAGDSVIESVSPTIHEKRFHLSVKPDGTGELQPEGYPSSQLNKDHQMSVLAGVLPNDPRIRVFEIFFYHEGPSPKSLINNIIPGETPEVHYRPQRRLNKWHP